MRRVILCFLVIWVAFSSNVFSALGITEYNLINSSGYISRDASTIVLHIEVTEDASSTDTFDTITLSSDASDFDTTEDDGKITAVTMTMMMMVNLIQVMVIIQYYLLVTLMVLQPQLLY